MKKSARDQAKRPSAAQSFCLEQVIAAQPN